jgi:hypothetical protein
MNPQSWNAYAYVNNNPLNATDPTGLETWNVGPCYFNTAYSYVDGQYQGSSTNFIGCFPNLTDRRLQDAQQESPPLPPQRVHVEEPPKNGAQQQVTTCVVNFYNSKAGQAAKFGSPLALMPGWNPEWRSNLKEWGTAIFGKLGGLLGSGATAGVATTEITTLRGTVAVGSKLELGTAATLEAIENVAKPAMVVATAADIMAHGTCAMAADPALANAALQSIP